MPAVTFDTLEFAKRLKSANFTEEQAEALIQVVSQALTEQVATKQDVENLRLEMKAEIGAVKSELKADIGAVRSELKADIKAEIAEVKASLVRWMFAFFVGQVAVLATLIKLIK